MDLHDVSIYVNAFNADSPHHDQCFSLLKDAAESAKNFGYSPLVLSGFVRIVTHPRILQKPASSSQALSLARSVTESPRALLVMPGKAQWTLFNHLCRRYELTGNNIPDAFFAALAMEADCSWVTLDRGFERFEDLRIALIS